MKIFTKLNRDKSINEIMIKLMKGDINFFIYKQLNKQLSVENNNYDKEDQSK